MTSPLRRKRRTIARSTWPARIHNQCGLLLCWGALIVVGMLTGWTSIRSAVAAVGGSDSDASAVQAASYSTGRSGGKLKWLPQRPDSVDRDTNVKAAAYTAPAELPNPVQTAQSLKPKSSPSPFIDPFGDKKKNTPTPMPAPAEKLDDKDLSPQMPAEPNPQESLPGPIPNEPAAAEKPYVAPESLTPLKQGNPKKSNSKTSELERQYAPQQHEFKEGCPSAKDLKQISELSTNITPPEGDLPHDCPLGSGTTFQERSFESITYAWTASGLCHKPLYFEDVQVERYGHMVGPWQSLASAAHFFLTVPILPYKMGLEPPNECIYDLGYYRPGNCAPYLLDPIPLSVRGALFEAGAWVGGVAAFP
jgi:hypothetical protein